MSLRFIGVLVILRLTSAGSILNIIQNDDHCAFLLMSLLVFPNILVQTADKIDKGSILELHLFDALANRTKALNCQIDPPSIILSVRVIDLLADPESHRITFLGKLDGCCAVISSRYDDLGCKYF